MMLKCNVCESELIPSVDVHYIARDCDKTGLAAAFSNNTEPSIFDAFDCPVCGCQIIAQERKRVYVQPNAVTVADDDDVEEDNGECDERI